MSDCRFITFHGWAFNDQFWHTWADRLSDYGVVKHYDRGYFNDPKEVETVAGPVRTVLIAHSFGLHMIEEAFFHQADLLIITSGFLHFHPYAAQYRRRSRLILQQMISEAQSRPQKVLKEFYKNTYSPQQPPEVGGVDMNHQLLIDDLKELHKSELDIGLLRKAAKVCILHGADDHIVPKQKGRQMYNQLEQKAQYFEIKNAGHALPFTHFQQCLEFITPEIEQLAETTTID